MTAQYIILAVSTRQFPIEWSYHRLFEVIIAQEVCSVGGDAILVWITWRAVPKKDLLASLRMPGRKANASFRDVMVNHGLSILAQECKILTIHKQG